MHLLIQIRQMIEEHEWFNQNSFISIKCEEKPIKINENNFNNKNNSNNKRRISIKNQKKYSLRLKITLN